MEQIGRRAFMAGGVALGGAALAGAASARNGKESKPMKVVVLTGSPRKNGNTNTLAARFIEGAKAAGHEVFRFDAAEAKVSPCRACNACGMNGPCVLKDDFEQLREKLVEADVIAFATPMYYFGFSAQLKAVIDRFYALAGRLHTPKRRVRRRLFRRHPRLPRRRRLRISNGRRTTPHPESQTSKLPNFQASVSTEGRNHDRIPS